MTIVELDPSTDRRWAALVAEHPGASLFHAPPWLRCVRDALGVEPRARVLVDDRGAPRAGVAWAVVDDLRGRRLRGFAFSDDCDVLADDPDVAAALVGPLLDGTPAQWRVRRPELLARVVADGGLRPTGAAAWHAVDATAPDDERWARLAASARQNVRRARDAGIVVRDGGGLDDVRLFHRLHAHLRKVKYRMLAQPVALFERLHDEFGPSGALHVLVAERDGQPVAATLYLRWASTLHYKFNASLDTAGRPNDLLLWEGTRLAHAHGLRAVDLGLSGLDQPGLLRFKEKYATSTGTITTLAGGDAVDDRGAGVLLGRLTELLTDPDTPDDVAARAGDLLYRCFA